LATFFQLGSCLAVINSASQGIRHGKTGGLCISSRGRLSMFRVSRGAAIAGDADRLEGVREILREQRPGQYEIDQISADALPLGRTLRQWGIGIKDVDGSVLLVPAPPEHKSRHKHGR
jgi:hypothetical protein